MKLIIASDEKTHVTDSVIEYLHSKGHELILLGDLVDEQMKWHWAEIGTEAAEKVVAGEADGAILFCWSGTGVCMAANKVPGARAALCWDSETARLARKWNDATILCMSLRYVSETVASEIIDVWLATNFDEETLDQVSNIH